MRNPKQIIVTPQDVPDSINGANYDINFFANDVTGASFALTATETEDGLAHIIAIRNNSATDHSGKTLTLTGTDENGNAQTEIITGPGANAIVESTLYFKTLPSVVPSASIGADTFDIGIAAEFASHIVQTDNYLNRISYTASLEGNANYAIDHTYNNVQTTSLPDIKWFNDNKDNITQSSEGNFGSQYPRAIRLRVNAYDSGAEIDWLITSTYQAA